MNTHFDQLQNLNQANEQNPFAAMATGFDPKSFDDLLDNGDQLSTEKAPKKLSNKAESVPVGAKSKKKRRNKPAQRENMMAMLDKLPEKK